MVLMTHMIVAAGLKPLVNVYSRRWTDRCVSLAIHIAITSQIKFIVCCSCCCQVGRTTDRLTAAMIMGLWTNRY